jgi:NADH-quinone oxidoreductase subunit K
MTVAAAEVAIGLALFVAVFRTRNTLDTDKIDLMRW